jgi:arabinan endo-1,5-alpha-L-arabinosidase
MLLSPVFSDYKLTGSVEPVRDPSMIRQGNTYYAFSTDDGAPVNGSIGILCSSDVVSWTECGHVFPAIPAWVQQAVPGVVGLWAPDVSYFNNAYHLYYVGSIFGTNRSVIGLATNVTLDPNDPEYAWIDRGQVLSSGSHDNFNALDPNIFIDTNGSIWLSYGSFWTGIKQAAIDPMTGMLLPSSSGPMSLALAARPNDSPHAIEAPFLVHHGNYYYLFVSFGLCCSSNPMNSNYRIMVGRSSSSHGPFSGANGISMLEGGGTQLLAGSTGSWNAPGGQSIFTDPASGDTTIVFHAHRLPAGTPYLFANTLTWNNDWPQISP